MEIPPIPPPDVLALMKYSPGFSQNSRYSPRSLVVSACAVTNASWPSGRICDCMAETETYGTGSPNTS